ncbi:hypothetical protein D5086_015610 [Populus alba]|uniref:Uncharacterized protein n=1 Tax=Populus alba TaxID=43335 RepID=A0ACC4BRN2_POPAL
MGLSCIWVMAKIGFYGIPVSIYGHTCTRVGKNGKPGTKISSEESQRNRATTRPNEILTWCGSSSHRATYNPLTSLSKLDQTAENVWVNDKNLREGMLLFLLWCSLQFETKTINCPALSAFHFISLASINALPRNSTFRSKGICGWVTTGYAIR